MPNERRVRDMARKVLQLGIIPARDPDRTWGGNGVGLPCVICGGPITRDEVEYEIQFAHDGANPGLDRYRMHIRCFAALGDGAGPALRPVSTRETPADPEPLRFCVAGAIAACNHATRVLQIGGREPWVPRTSPSPGWPRGRRWSHTATAACVPCAGS